MRVEIIGLGMFAIVVAGAIVLGVFIVVLRAFRVFTGVPGLLWEVSPWGRRQLRAQSQDRRDTMNRAERIRLHVIDRAFLHSAPMDAATRTEFNRQFMTLAGTWFASHPDQETLPNGFGDELVREFRQN